MTYGWGRDVIISFKRFRKSSKRHSEKAS